MWKTDYEKDNDILDTGFFKIHSSSLPHGIILQSQ